MAVAVSEGCVPVIRFNHTSWMFVVTPIDRPNSDSNRCVIEVLGGVFVLSIEVFSDGVVFRDRTESDLFFSSFFQ